MRSGLFYVIQERSALLPDFIGVLREEILPAGIFLFRDRVIRLEIMANGGRQSVGGIQLRQHRLLRNMQETLQHSSNLFFSCVTITGDRHLDLQRGIFKNRGFRVQGQPP